jgi:chromosome segregation ATPase
MPTTLEELDKRVSALEESRPTDLRRAVTKIAEHVEETRLRMSAVERHLDDIRRHMFEATAESARRHGLLEAKINAVDTKIDSVRAELKSDIAGLRHDLPSIVAETMREVLKEQRGS